jgi:hypothetical protein
MTPTGYAGAERRWGRSTDEESGHRRPCHCPPHVSLRESVEEGEREGRWLQRVGAGGAVDATTERREGERAAAETQEGGASAGDREG